MGKFIGWFACLILLFSGCASIPVSDRVYCPKCHRLSDKSAKLCQVDLAPLNGYKYWFWSRDRKPPVMAYPAETYLIKKDNKFIWSPYEVNLHDSTQNKNDKH